MKSSQAFFRFFISLFDSHKRWLFLCSVFLAAGSLALGEPRIFSISFLLALSIVLLHLLGGGPSGLIFRRGKFARRLRVTKSGRILALVTCGIGAVAMFSGLNLVHLVLGLVIGAMAASWFVSKGPLSKITVTRRLPVDIFANKPFKVDITLRNSKRWASSISVLFEDAPGSHPSLWPGKVYFSKLPAGSGETLSYSALIPGRGLYTLSNCHLTTRFPFGFFERAISLPSAESFLVFPRLGQLKQEILPSDGTKFGGWAEKTFSKGGGEEFYGLREYRPGDNPHHIHWKSSAKLAKPLVREFERSEQEAVSILLDTFISDTAGGKRRENLELAISFVATLAKLLEESNISYSFYAISGSLVVVPGGRGQAHFYRLYRTLAILEPSTNYTLADLVRRAKRDLINSTFLVAVLLGADEEALSPLAQIPGRSGTVKLVDVSAPSFNYIFSLDTSSEVAGEVVT